MSNVFSGPAADAIDVTLLEAVELLQADLEVLRVHVAEIVDDYRAVKLRSAEVAASWGPAASRVGPLPDVVGLEATLAELAALLVSG
jgi:hypothetical protein